MCLCIVLVLFLCVAMLSWCDCVSALLCLHRVVSCQALGPEFIRMADEPQVVLELPGSIVVRTFTTIFMIFILECIFLLTTD